MDQLKKMKGLVTKGVPAPGVGVGAETPPRQPARTPALRGRPTAHEMDDLEAVTVFQLGLRPGIARSDVAVQLYGYAVGLHAEGLDQRQERQGIGCEALLVAVDVKFHAVYANLR